MVGRRGPGEGLICLISIPRALAFCKLGVHDRGRSTLEERVVLERNQAGSCQCKGGCEDSRSHQISRSHSQGRTGTGNLPRA